MWTLEVGLVCLVGTFVGSTASVRSMRRDHRARRQIVADRSSATLTNGATDASSVSEFRARVHLPASATPFRALAPIDCLLYAFKMISGGYLIWPVPVDSAIDLIAAGDKRGAGGNRCTSRGFPLLLLCSKSYSAIKLLHASPASHAQGWTNSISFTVFMRGIIYERPCKLVSSFAIFFAPDTTHQLSYLTYGPRFSQ